MTLEKKIMKILGQNFVIDASSNSLRYAPEFATQKLIKLFEKEKNKKVKQKIIWHKKPL